MHSKNAQGKARAASIFLFRERQIHLVLPNEHPDGCLDREMAPVKRKYSIEAGGMQGRNALSRLPFELMTKIPVDPLVSFIADSFAIWYDGLDKFWGKRQAYGKIIRRTSIMVPRIPFK